MKLRMNVFSALFKKDIKNCLVNKNIAVMLLLPIGFAALYIFILSGQLDARVTNSFVLSLTGSLVLATIPLNVLAMMIAEEKEKHTLRSLMMANVSASEFLFSKCLVGIILITFESIFVFLITKQDVSLLPQYFSAMILAAIGITFFGAVVGIASKDQMAAGTLSTPLMILLLLPTMFADFNDFLRTVSTAFPSTSVQTIFASAVAGEGVFTTDCLIAYGVCIAWIVIGGIAFAWFYKKRGLDD